MNPRRATAVLLLLLVSAAPAPPAVPQFNESVEVSIVNLDVVVTDRDGHRVQGLKPADFEIRENGKLQTLTNFSEVREDAAPAQPQAAGHDAAPPAARQRPPNERRIVTVFIERARLKGFEADRFFGALDTLLRDIVRPGDEAAIVFWENGLEVTQDFTGNTALLSNALAELRERNKRAVLPESRSIEAREREQRDMDSLVAGSPSPPPDIMIGDSVMLARHALWQIRSKIFALRSFVSLMAPNQGRKVLVVATRRLSRYAGAEFFSGGTVPFDWKQEFDTTPLFKTLEDAANGAGVTIYAFHPPGLDTPALVSSENGDPASVQIDVFNRNVLLNEMTALDDLARVTGGVSAWGATDIAAKLPEVAADLQTYYSLGYRTPPGHSKQHAVEVRTVDRRYTVRARTSLIEKNDRELMSERVLANLFHETPSNLAEITAELGEPRKQGRHYELPLKIHIPIAHLTPLRGNGNGWNGSFTVFAVAGGRVGVASEVMQKTQEFHIPAEDLEKARGSYYTYELTLVTDGEAENISVGVLDEVSKEFGITRVNIRE